MVQKVRVTTPEHLETLYGEVARRCNRVSIYRSRKALLEENLDVSEAVLARWLLTYQAPANAIMVSNAVALQETYSDIIKPLAPDNPTGYKLMNVLKTLDPPLYVARKTAANWLKMYWPTDRCTQIIKRPIAVSPSAHRMKRPAVCPGNTKIEKDSDDGDLEAELASHMDAVSERQLNHIQELSEKRIPENNGVEMQHKVKVKTAADLEDLYGTLVRKCNGGSIYLSRKALLKKNIDVSEHVLKRWMMKYRPANAVVVETAEELQEKYGDKMKELSTHNRTGYKLGNASKTLVPPLYVTRAVATKWLKKYSSYTSRKVLFKSLDKYPSVTPVSKIISMPSPAVLSIAARRRIMPTGLDAEGLKNWLYWQVHFPVSVQQCQKWIDDSGMAQRPSGAVSPPYPAYFAGRRIIPPGLDAEGLKSWLYAQPYLLGGSI